MSKRVKFSIKPREQKLMVDMEYLGSQMLRNPNKVARVINKFGDDGFLSFFSQFGISTKEKGVPGISNEKIAESLIRWRIKDNTMQATKIVDNRQLPAEIKANTPFRISLSDNWVETDAIFVSEDAKYVFYVSAKHGGIGGGGGYDYDLEFVSSIRNQVLDRKELLNIGRFLNYSGNGKGELSTTSQPLKFDDSAYDMFNVTQVIRHELAASGHALSTDMVTIMEEYDTVTRSKELSYLPFNANLLKSHLGFVGSTLFFQRTNFNALERRVLTTNNKRARPEIPLTSGVREQFEYTESVYEYNPYDNPLNQMKLLEGIMAERSEYFREDSCIYLAITGNGGARVLENVKQEKISAQKVSLDIELKGNKLENVGYTTKSATYHSYSGEFTVLNTSFMTKPRGWKSERAAFEGATYDKDSFDIFLVPVYKMDDGRRSVRIATKSRGNIDRGLVIGSIAGMSGLYNSHGGVDLSKMDASKDTQFANNVLMMDSYKVASATDGEVWMALSEMAAIVEDVDSITWIKAKFPNR